MTNDYLTVSALTKYIKRKFDSDPYLERVYLTGEISNFRNRPGHQYFSVKDNNAVISATMFKSAYQRLKFTPEEGMKVLVIGRISVYSDQGKYQIYIEHMEPDGVGALYQALEEMKKKLKQEGLFDAPKKLIPTFPKRIAVVTSPSGAVIQDIMTTVKRRFPIVELVLFPTKVQGKQAADTIVESIRQVEAKGDFDTLIIARGGGSIEDLWPFNEEKVARAIFNSKTPVISSVGHETDTTIADLVADVRASTPTAAAELAVPQLTEEIVKIEQVYLRLLKGYQRKVERADERLKHSLNSYVFRQPQRLYESYTQNVDILSERLGRVISDKITKRQQDLKLYTMQLQTANPANLVQKNEESLIQLSHQLNQEMKRYMDMQTQRLDYGIQSLDYLSPLKIMHRGYSYVLKEDKIIKDAQGVQVGDTVDIQLSKGNLKATVTEKTEDSND